MGGQVVNLSNPLTSSIANPANFSVTTGASTTRNVSVQPLAGYDIGYSLCYNSSCAAGAITPGLSVLVEDFRIRALGAGSANPYASLYWHYCPVLTAVQNIQPNNQACIPSGSSTLTTITWDLPASGTPTSYLVYLDDDLDF